MSNANRIPKKKHVDMYVNNDILYWPHPEERNDVVLGNSL